MKKTYRYLPVFFLGLFLLGCRSTTLLHPYQEGKHLIAAHRGFHTEVPENSVGSIKRAIEHNIDIVEIDVRISRDGVPVLMHDEKVDRTTNGSGSLSGFEVSELKQLKLLYKGTETNYTVPTLMEVLEVGKGKILFDLDIKTSQIEKIIEIVEETESHESVFFFDSDWEILKKVKQTHPTWKIMPRAYNEKEAKEAYERFKPWAVHVDPSFATPELSDYLHKRGAHVWINALGAVDEEISTGNAYALQILLNTKSNIIQTDWPVKVKGLITNPEFTTLRTRYVTYPMNFINGKYK